MAEKESRIVAIHQPHYFPWLGYFDKMAKVERFVIMDQVQFVPRSYMSRNSFVDRNGEIMRLSLIVSKTGHREKELRQIEVINCEEWQNKHALALKKSYQYMPYYEEVMNEIHGIFEKPYSKLIDVQMDTIISMCRMLDINTELVFQSDLSIEPSIMPDDSLSEEEQKQIRRCMDVIHICTAAQASGYITGRGKSLEFVDPNLFEKNHIKLALQDYTCPVYQQRHTREFVPNISALDFLFNCGIEEARRIFWKNVHSTHEFSDIQR